MIKRTPNQNAHWEGLLLAVNTLILVNIPIMTWDFDQCS